MAQKMSQQKHSELKDLRSQHGTANWNWGGGQIHSRITLGDAFAETFRGVFDIFKEFSCPSWHKVLFKQRYCSVHAHDDFFDGRKRMESLCWLNTLIHGKSCEIFGWTNWVQGEPVLWKVNWSGDRALSSPWGTAQLSRLWAASPLLVHASSGLCSAFPIPLTEICPCRQKLQRMAQMKGKGLFYIFMAFSLSVYPHTDVFLPPGSRRHCTESCKLQLGVEQLRTKEFLPEISPILKETSFSGNLKRYSHCTNTTSLKTT